MKKNINFNDFRTLIQNEPLIEAEPTLAAIKPTLLNQKKGGIFFGVGIMSKEKLSVGVPFDILAMFFVAENLRRFLNFHKVIILIADTHALSNALFAVAQIHKVALNTMQILQKAITNFNLTNVELLLASQISMKPEFQSVLNNLPKMQNEYLRLEIADSLFFQKRDNLRIKLGWTMQKDNREVGHDERFFDRDIERFCPDLSFVHLKPGRAFDKNRQRVSPYLSIFGESRLLLQPEENVKDKIELALKDWHDPNFGGTIRHLANIVRAFEKLFGRLGNVSLEEKVQTIIDKALK